jgi:uncharacterized protein GlcG (DUF336 family)
VAVVDAGGHLIRLHRMDGVPFIAAEIARRKAWARPPQIRPPKPPQCPIRNRHHRCQRRPVNAASRRNPLRRRGTMIGAVGASGLAD